VPRNAPRENRSQIQQERRADGFTGGIGDAGYYGDLPRGGNANLKAEDDRGGPASVRTLGSSLHGQQRKSLAVKE